MKNMLIFTALLMLNLPSNSQVNEKEALTHLLHNFLEGASNNDRETHENFWAEDLIYTSSNGSRFGKAQIMAGFENGRDVSDTPKTVFTAEEIQVRVYGDMAVVAFKMKGTTGEAVQYYYNSGTFIKRDKKWQVVNWQATKIPD